MSFAAPVIAAREVNGQEQPTGSANVSDGALTTSFTPYQPRTFAVRLRPSATKVASIQSQPVSLHYDLAVATNDDTKTVGGGLDGHGNALPAEMLPDHIDYHGVRLNLAPAKTASLNAVVTKGQTIPLPTGRFNRVYILAASADGDQTTSFRVGERAVNLNIQDWGGFIGQWDTRVWKDLPQSNWAISANHPVWPPPDLQRRERPDPTPLIPATMLAWSPASSSPRAWRGMHRITTPPMDLMSLINTRICSPIRWRSRPTTKRLRCRITARSGYSRYPSPRRIRN